MVKGISLKPEIVDVSNDDWDESTNVYGVRDEIIDQEGEYEELIAIDRYNFLFLYSLNY